MSSAESGMLSKAVLLVIAVSLPLLLVVATATDEQQQQGVEKRAPRPIQTPTTLADMAKVLVDIQKRMNAVESSRTMLLRGRDGRDGLPGKPGRNGRNYVLPGQPGPPGPPGPKSSGVQYVRWGRTSCPSGASLVYKGRTGGEHYTHTGGGTNYVCLPETPKYGRYKDSHQYAGYMYGTEYEINDHKLFSKNNLQSHDAPCAVCYVRTRSAKMMIPATYECPAGWKREYHGYLMAERYNHNAKQFVCVDQDAEAVPGTHAYKHGALLYPVEGRCGALPCHPYVEGRELTCAVCTK